MSRVERSFRDTVLFPQISEQARALVRSQGGPITGRALAATPSCHLTRIESHLFRVVLLRRLRQRLPLSARSCRCGRPLDAFGHHRAACARAGVLGLRGFAVESVVARICREGGGRVRTNIMLRDLDMELTWEMPGGSKSSWMVCPCTGDGNLLWTPRWLGFCTPMVNPCEELQTKMGCALSLLVAGKKDPELVGRRGRATLVVLAGEVGGRWSGETISFLNQFAKARARSESILMRKRVEQAWRLRWASMLSCVAARAVASSLLDFRRPHGADGATPPSHEVDWEFRYAGLA